MARIRQVEIANFRGIDTLQWNPGPGINCLIGRGDSGKSTVIEAINYCLSPRRNISFSDADFRYQNYQSPIRVSVTVGELPETFLDLERFGEYHRGFDVTSQSLSDEPTESGEIVLTVQLSVGRELEPSWSLYSDRAAARGHLWDISWRSRQLLAPTRIATTADHNFGLGRNSVLSTLAAEGSSDVSPLIEAERGARRSFDDSMSGEFNSPLQFVNRAAVGLGITSLGEVQLKLDPDAVSLNSGTISLHDARGTPLRALGAGSKRLLLSGLLRIAGEISGIVTLDEIEHGLEPHRIIRFLESLGSKTSPPPLQVFAATHSAVVVRELAANQIGILRNNQSRHEILAPQPDQLTQGTLRAAPEAFLAESILICEGASEVGLIRGLNQYFSANASLSIFALGVSLVDAKGVDNIYGRAAPFSRFKYRVASFRDSDKDPDPMQESRFQAAGGTVFKWADGRALEDEMFLALPAPVVAELLDASTELLGEQAMNDQIGHYSDGKYQLDDARQSARAGIASCDLRTALRKASKSNRWFKSVSTMEYVGRRIIGPHIRTADPLFKSTVDSIFSWARNTTG